ncbi:MAG: hypothetical protein WC795_01455 [Candidatus Paceibacterota bacterium]|jgi:hypothetical protein
MEKNIEALEKLLFDYDHAGYLLRDELARNIRKLLDIIGQENPVHIHSWIGKKIHNIGRYIVLDYRIKNLSIDKLNELVKNLDFSDNPIWTLATLVMVAARFNINLTKSRPMKYRWEQVLNYLAQKMQPSENVENSNAKVAQKTQVIDKVEAVMVKVLLDNGGKIQTFKIYSVGVDEPKIPKKEVYRALDQYGKLIKVGSQGPSACEKTGYSKKEAQTHVNYILKERKTKLRCYECDVCGRWHLTHQAKHRPERFPGENYQAKRRDFYDSNAEIMESERTMVARTFLKQECVMTENNLYIECKSTS